MADNFSSNREWRDNLRNSWPVAGNTSHKRAINRARSSRASGGYEPKRAPRQSSRAEYSYQRVEPVTKKSNHGSNSTAKDAMADLFTFDIPMKGESFDAKKFVREHKKPLLITFGSLAGAAILVGFFILIFRVQSSTVANNKNVNSRAQQAVGFNPLVPLGKESKTGREVRDSDFIIDQEKNVLGYNSEYGGVKVTVSQQKLPDDFKSNPDEGLSKVASSIGADHVFETQKGMAHLKTDEKTGKQIAVFATDENLVFIQTDKELLPDDWEFYINQLSPR